MAISFYNAGDNAIYDSGQHFVPQEKYRLGYTPPAAPEVIATVPGGITNTNAFTNSGGGGGIGGNAFGYGSQIEPGGSYGSYDSINYTGGLPGNVQQYGIGRQFEDPSASPIGETYSYKKEVPGFMRAGAAFIPGGNFLLNLAEKRMNTNRDQPPGNYRIGGLDESMKGYYDNLAGSGMLFNGPGGVKTLTGKNFAGKGYLEGQLDIYNDKFAGMTEEEIEELKNDPRKQFKYKQYLESSQMYKTNKAQEKEAEEQKKQEEATKAANNLRFKQEQDRLDGLVGTTVIDRNTGTSSVVQNESGGNDPGTSRRSDHAQAAGLGSNAGNVRAANAAGTGSAQSYNQNLADGGRAGYFFGGRVNYKVGGRTDAGPNRTTASKAGVGQINESGQKVSGGNFNNNNNDGGNNPPPTFYDNGVQVITDQSKFGFNYPTGLTKNLGVGQLTAILDARKSLEEEEPEGMIQYDSSLGPIDTTMSYDTTTGPEFNATYSNNNLNANYNTKTGLGVNYSKDIGPGTFTAGGTYNPDGTYNAEAKISFNYANGGLAGLL